MSPTSILHLGTDAYFVQECVSRGLRTVVVRNIATAQDGRVRLPTAAEEVYVEDFSRVEDVLLTLAAHGISIEDFDAIQASTELGVIAASVLAEHASITHIPLSVAMAMRSKHLQNTAVRRAGLAAAKSCLIANVESLQFLRSLSAPLVIKPLAGVASEKVVVVNSLAEAHEVLSKMMTAGSFIPYLLCQEMVQGAEFMIDGIVFEGTVAFASMALCQRPWLTVVETGAPGETHRVRDKEYPGLRGRAHEFASEVLKALNYRSGIFHLEGFLTPDGSLIFGECAARRGGVLVEEEVRLQHGVSLAAAAVDLAIGSAPSLAPKEYPEIVGTTFLRLGSEGIVTDLPSRDDLMRLPGVHFIRYESYIGARSSLTYSSLLQRAGLAVLSAEDRPSLLDRMGGLRNCFLKQAMVVPISSARASRDFQVKMLNRGDLQDRNFEMS